MGESDGEEERGKDIVMKDRSDHFAYEDIFGYEHEDDEMAAATLATKKKAAPRSAARAAGKRYRPAKTPSRSTSPEDNGPLVNAIVI